MLPGEVSAGHKIALLHRNSNHDAETRSTADIRRVAIILYCEMNGTTAHILHWLGTKMMLQWVPSPERQLGWNAVAYIRQSLI